MVCWQAWELWLWVSCLKMITPPISRVFTEKKLKPCFSEHLDILTNKTAVNIFAVFALLPICPSTQVVFWIRQPVYNTWLNILCMICSEVVLKACFCQHKNYRHVLQGTYESIWGCVCKQYLYTFVLFSFFVCSGGWPQGFYTQLYPQFV